MAHSPLDVDADAAVDLDAVPGAAQGPGAAPAPPRRRSAARRPPGGWRELLGQWPAGTPAWARGPAAALALALAASALTWAAGVRHVRAVAEDAATADLAVLSLQVGTPQVGGWSTDRVRTGTAQPPAVVPVLVPLSNRGDHPVRVTVLGVTSVADRALEPAHTVFIGVRNSATAYLQLRGGCEDAPRAAGAARGQRDAEQVRVRLEVGSQRRELSVPFGPTSSGTVAQQLEWVCAPWGDSDGVTASGRTQDDGRLAFTVANRGSRPAIVDVQDSMSLGLTSDVSLPTDLPAGSSLDVVLALQPRCDRIAAGESQQVDLVAAQPPSGEGAPGARVLSDQLLTAPWIARQVALACG